MLGIPRDEYLGRTHKEIYAQLRCYIDEHKKPEEPEVWADDLDL
jgi:hypothetical protein